jgi:hypothetical protein
MSKYVRSNYVSQNSEPTDYASDGVARRELQDQLAALQEENERLELELSEAQCQVKLWAFKGHAPWCEVQNNGDKCHCGHAETMAEIPEPEDL